MEDVESHEVDAGHALSAGEMLRAAREKTGLSRVDVASQTKIAERHLEAIEDDRFADLAARTYAVGFSRAYARAVGLDEKVIAAKVREQLDADSSIHAPTIPSFEPGDPARVPPLRLAWVAAGGAILVIGLLVFFWSSFFSPEGSLPSLLPEDAPTQAAVSKPAPVPTVAAPQAEGPVVLTAKADRIWIKVTDADGAQLFQKELAQGESWTVPTGARGAMLRTGRPDALTVSIGGKPVAALPDKPVTISDVSLAAADLRARANASAASAMPAGSATAASGPAIPAQPSRAPASGASSTPSPATGAATVPSPRPSRTGSIAAPGTGSSPRPSASASTSTRPAASPSPVPSRTAGATPATGTGISPSPALSRSPVPVATTSAPLSTDSE